MRDIKKIVQDMTLEEKTGMLSGADFWHTKAVERLGIPAVMLADGPHGLRKQNDGGDMLGVGASIEAVCFPAACATASSFDVELMEDFGKTLGDECQAENVSVLLGPAVNIKRSPLCGRNFEYISEDPYLAGKMAAAYIRGVQSKGVGTSMKHFAANNQEYMRMSCSSEVSERAFREIYLSAFEEAVKTADPKTIMCSYNKINGVYSAENRRLLTEILRDEWGFDGYVMTDWGAVADRVEGVKAGLELEMPSSNGINDAKVAEAVKNGTLDEKLVDQAVERILNVIFSYVDNRREDAVFDREKDHEKAVALEAECGVLLENNGVLPLKKDMKIAYIGAFAGKPRYQGGGSSHIRSHKIVSALEAAQQKGRNVSYAEGFPFDRDETDEEMVSKALQCAEDADAAVIFAGLPDSFESEGYDRKSMVMPECQNTLIEKIAKVQPNTIVVLHNGSPVETTWADKVAAVLEMYLGGEGVGEATDQLLFGEVNPSGHLAETFPCRLEDTPSYLNFPGDGRKAIYAEDVFVGYRYYEKKKVSVRWAFGHGLSYTQFTYGNIVLSSDKLDDDGILTVNVDVTNSGSVKGKAVAQMYIADKNGTPLRPVKELKGFRKVELEPGETKTVSMQLKARDLSYYDEGLHDWYAPQGTYEIQIGEASDDIRVSAEISFTTKKYPFFEVSMASTLGELFADPRTAAAMQEAMAGVPAEMSESATGDVMNAEAVKETINAMPLKTLVSFGILKTQDAENLICMMNQKIQNR